MAKYEIPSHRNDLDINAFFRITLSSRWPAYSGERGMDDDLLHIKREYWQKFEYQFGETISGDKFLSWKQLRDLFGELEDVLKDKGSMLERAYLVLGPNDEVYSQIPPSLSRTLGQIQKLQSLANSHKEHFGSFVQSGPATNFALIHMFGELVKVYEKYSGVRATTNSFRKSEPEDRWPTEFQMFVRACFKEFGVPEIKSLDAKVHKLLSEWRKSNKIS